MAHLTIGASDETLLPILFSLQVLFHDAEDIPQETVCKRQEDLDLAMTFITFPSNELAQDTAWCTLHWRSRIHVGKVDIRMSVGINSLSGIGLPGVDSCDSCSEVRYFFQGQLLFQFQQQCLLFWAALQMQTLTD